MAAFIRAGLHWVRSLFAWRFVRDSGVWLYSENTVTGERKALRIGSCWQPVDLDWLDNGNGYRIYDFDGLVSRRVAGGAQ